MSIEFAYAGDDIDASHINDRTMFYIAKAGAESVTSSTTYQDDDDLAVTLPVGVWRVQVFLSASGLSAAGLKTQWTTTGTITGIGRLCHGPAETATPASGDARMVSTGLGNSMIYGLTSAGVYEDLLVEVTVSGVLQLQWAQNASNGTATTLSTASRMFITQVAEWPYG